jgi:hypothetical protein
MRFLERFEKKREGGKKEEKGAMQVIIPSVFRQVQHDLKN